MGFGAQLREYREEHLDISQKEMARTLGIDTTNMSRYEADKHQFTVDFIQKIRETYDIPDDMFLAMIEGTPLRSVRKSMHTWEDPSTYSSTFLGQHAELVEEEKDLRRLLAFAASLTDDDRKLLLSGLSNLIQLYENLLKK